MPRALLHTTQWLLQYHTHAFRVRMCYASATCCCTVLAATVGTANTLIIPMIEGMLVLGVHTGTVWCYAEAQLLVIALAVTATPRAAAASWSI